MKHSVTLLILLLVPLLSACARWERPLSAAVLGAGGGYLGHELSDGDPAITAASAAGGVAISEGLQALKRKREREAYLEGYTRGRGDSVKSLYWQLVDHQRTREPATSHRLIPVTIPEHVEDGVLVKPSTRILRIQD
ncbi:MAG: hypothetical protein AB7O66_14655 [Limisphaerales bacterium]